MPVLVAEGDGDSGLLPCPVDGGGQAGGGDNKEEGVGGPARGGREVGEGELASTMDGNLYKQIYVYVGIEVEIELFLIVMLRGKPN